jgi:AcrR family transcriptional regulator
MAATVKGNVRREQILYASLAAFAEAAGISEPGLIHHFPTKPALLLETLEFHGRRAFQESMGAEARTFGEHLVNLAAAHERDPRFIRLLLVLAAEGIDPEHPAHEWFVARYDDTRIRMERQFAADQGAKLLRGDVDPALVARQAIAVMDGLELQFLLDPRRDIVTPLTAWLRPLYVR